MKNQIHKGNWRAGRGGIESGVAKNFLTCLLSINYIFIRCLMED